MSDGIDAGAEREYGQPDAEISKPRETNVKTSYEA